MMQICLKSIVCLAISLLLFGVAGLAQAAALTVLTPADKVYLESEQLNLVLSVSDMNATSVAVSVGGKNYRSELKTLGREKRLCLAVTLLNGLNKIELIVAGSAGVIERRTLAVYLRSPLLKQYQKPPDDFKRHYFHTDSGEMLCAGCHRMEATLKDLYPEKIADSPCYVCHKNKSVPTFKHKPVSSGACFSCHQVADGKRKYSTKKPDQVTCLVCHSAEGKLWKGKRVQHGPTATGNCTICHNPHGSNYASFVHLQPTALCLNCHNDKKSGLHVIAGFFGKGHPVTGKADPFKKDRSFSCASCHNPHAGDSQSLLNKERDSFENYCQSCHKL